MSATSPTTPCHYFGMKDDPATAVAYPSTGNHCFHCRYPAVPVLDHQSAYCLSPAHISCPVYNKTGTEDFPGELKYMSGQRRRGRRPVWVYYLVAGGFLLVALLIWQISRYNSLTNMADSQNLQSTQAGVIPISTPTVEILLSPTVTRTKVPPTVAPTVTATAVPYQKHALEELFIIDDRTFVMHRIEAGEQTDIMLRKFTTSVEVIEAINYINPVNLIPPLPLWVGRVIVLAPGMVKAEPNLPILEPYLVDEQDIKIDDLAAKLNIDIDQMRHYNGCFDACWLSKGEWVLVPHTK